MTYFYVGYKKLLKETVAQFKAQTKILSHGTNLWTLFTTLNNRIKQQRPKASSYQHRLTGLQKITWGNSCSIQSTEEDTISRNKFTNIINHPEQKKKRKQEHP